MIYREKPVKSRTNNAHPTGESKIVKLQNKPSKVSVDTFDGKVNIEWDQEATVTPLGQLPFFIEFLKISNLFEPFVTDCPLNYTSNNASTKRDILGTFLLSILAGHTRYAHITALRSDKVNPPLLGMNKVVSEDTARRSLKKMDPELADKWLTLQLNKCYQPLLSNPWILDVDSTVKTLYGEQEDALVGYNPTKRGRPSHAYHSYFIANIRLILDTVVTDGKSNAGIHSSPRLWELLSSIPRENWPKFIRGDISYGTENIMREAEARGVNYLFKLKCTANVKKVITSMMCKHGWCDAGQNWEGMESEIQLKSWSDPRRIIIMRKRINKQVGIVKETGMKQLSFEFAEIDDKIHAYEYSVLVTDLQDEILTLAQHYRDRADAENNFDELKNQWGWAGFTTQDKNRCQIAARMIALVYNWWNLFVRLANPDSHLEAITSRPLLLHAIGRQTKHAGQKNITITSMHGKSTKVSLSLTAISKFFSVLRSKAEQLSPSEIFREILFYAFRKFIPIGQNDPPMLLT
ncbi:MAG: transposase [Thiotrichales bacterium]|nr:MAG: transposase [Thiotrichales bacterium]